MAPAEVGNLDSRIPGELPKEIVEIVAQGQNVRIERIVSRGHCSPPGFWYDQGENEWVLVIKGEAKMRFARDDRIVHLTAGDYVDIPAHTKHRVEWTQENADTVWLAVFY